MNREPPSFLVPSAADMDQFASGALESIALHSLRFESMIDRYEKRFLSVDVTLFNGQHFLVFLGTPCDFIESEGLLLRLPEVAAKLPRELVARIVAEASKQWRASMSDQGTPYVNSFAIMTDLPGSPLGAQATTPQGLSERDIPGRAPYRNIVRALRAYQFAASYASGKSVLDYGCGSGLGSQLLAQTAEKVCGVDLDAEAIVIAHAFNLKENVVFLPTTSTTPDSVADGPFDVVTAFEVMEHTDDPGAFLQLLKGFLAPEGVLLLTVPNRQYHGKHINPFHKTDFTLDFLSELLRSQFEDVSLYGQRASRSTHPFENYSVESPADNSDEHFVAVCTKRDCNKRSDRKSHKGKGLRVAASSKPRARILMVGRTDALTYSSRHIDAVLSLKECIAKKDHRLQGDVILSTHPLADGYDAVHVFNF